MSLKLSKPMSPTACLSYRSSLRSFHLWEERQKNGTLEMNVSMQLYVVEDQHLQKNQPLFWQHVSSPVKYFVRVKICIQSLSMWHRLFLTGSVDSHHHNHKCHWIPFFFAPYLLLPFADCRKYEMCLFCTYSLWNYSPYPLWWTYPWNFRM